MIDRSRDSVQQTLKQPVQKSPTCRYFCGSTLLHCSWQHWSHALCHNHAWSRYNREQLSGIKEYAYQWDSFIHSLRWHVQNVTIPCRSQFPFPSVGHFSLPPLSTNYSSIPSHFILPSISWSTSKSCFSHIHI